jgi:hypothetical protein
MKHLLPLSILKQSVLAMILSILFTSCNILKNEVDKIDFTKPINKAEPALSDLASKAGENFVLGATKALPQAASGLKGFADTLNPDIKKLIHAIAIAGDTTNIQLTKLGDNLHWQIGRLKGDLKFTDELVAKIMRTLDKNSQRLLTNMLQNALDSMNSPASKAKLDSIIGNILSEKTSMRTQQLVNNTLQPTIDTLTSRIDKIVHKDIPFVQRQASMIIGGITLAALLIIGFVWYQRRKYLRLIKVLTYQIDQIGDQSSYDNLTKHISSQTKKEDLEPLLKNILSEQGIN